MDDVRSAPLNTREFVARWHATVDEHLVNKLADSLSQLAATQPGSPALQPEQYRVAAHQIVMALHLAADSGGGVPEAVDYLVQVAAEVAGS